MDIDDLLRTFRDGQDTSEDRTLHVRERPGGREPRVDFEVVERVNWANSYPETVREFRSKEPLPCGHPVTRENPFGGYCKGNKFLNPLASCETEYCSICATPCECGRVVSAFCCARIFEGKLVCKACRRKLRLIKAFRICFAILIHPFISDTSPDES